MFILWFGWFGFNGGSELKLSNIDEANAVAQVFVNTNMAAACGAVAALLMSQIFWKGRHNDGSQWCLGGPCLDYRRTLSGTHAESMLIGAIGGVLVVLSLIGLDKAKIDDPVGAISVHGTCGIWGLLAVLITSEDATLQGQLTGLGAILGFTFVASLVVWFVIKMVMEFEFQKKKSLLDWIHPR